MQCCRRMILFKMVVSDVDGTLIYKNAHLNTARFPVMLSKLSDLSIPFAVATGRHYRELEQLFGENLRFPCVCCDGAYVMVLGNKVYSLPVGNNALEYFESVADEKSIAVEFHSVGTTYLLGGSSLLLAKEKRRLGDATVKKISARREIDSEIYFVSVYGRKANLTPPHMTRVSYSAPGISEFTNAEASKYRAVTELAKYLGLCEKDILFFGDGENDRGLIENCAISYTAYCADKSVFSLTPHHTRDVIGTVIRLADEVKNNRLHS